MSGGPRYPRPAELAALGPGHNVVEASAGTGKTYLLEHLFLDLVLRHGVPAEQILVVTFTEKATAELVLRLRRQLAEVAALTAEHPKAVAARDAAPDAAWLIDERARALLEQALLGFDRIGIFTMHAFCERVLREHAFVQGRLFDEERVEGTAAFAAAFAEVLRTRAATDARLAALLRAWLAEGKTIAGLRACLAKCAAAKASGLRPVLDEARLVAALAALASWRGVSADDARLDRLLAKAKLRADVRASCLERLAVLSRQVQAGAGGYLPFLEARRGQDDPLEYLLEKLAGRALDPDLAALHDRLAELRAAMVPLEAVVAQAFLPIVDERAARQKRATGRFDFDDMLGLVEAALAEPGPAGRALAAGLRARYRHALIDEFQDTDDVQWSIFRRIFVDPNHPDRHGLTVVGDPKQAIYAFRGANVETYLEARDALLANGARRLVLDRNFRSSSGMVDATNLLFEQAAGFFPPEGGIVYDPPVRCGKPSLALITPAGQPAAPVVLWDLATAQPKLKADDARAALTSAIVRELGALFADQPPVFLDDGDGGGPRRPHPRDVFLLTFTNSESQDLGRALAAARIPYAFYKQEGLFGTAEAAEVLDVLAAVGAPEDASLRARALLTRFFGLGLEEVAAAAPGSEPMRVLAGLAARAEAGDVPGVLSALLEDTGVLRRELFAGAGERALTNFMHVIEVLHDEWARTGAGLPELTARLAAFVAKTAAPPGREGDLQRLETDADAVQILTVHKAKGLEAGIVFLYGGTCEGQQDVVRVVHEDGQRLAYVGALDDAVKQRFAAERWGEDCRLLYVAATRARYRLYLPRYPAALTRLDGRYAPMNRRLDGLGEAGGSPLVEHQRLDCDAPAAAPAAPAAPARPPASLDPRLLELPGVPADVDAIRRERAGFLVTSYSAVKRARAARAPEEAAVALAGSLASPDEPRGAPVPVPDGLPGGADTGIFLHELLARVSLEMLATRPALDDWRARPEVLALFEQERRRAGRAPHELEPAARLVHRAYTTPVALAGEVIAGLAAVSPALRELEFLYPMPERAHPLLSAPAGGERPREPPWRIERGAVKGFIDFLFEHGGRVFVCDWKSDVLPGYDAATLDEHCREHYEVQARLYTLAALRMCAISDRAACARRFGGVVFCFLRGLGPGGAGLVHRTPSWDDLVAWEREMLGSTFWGLPA